MVDSSVAAKDLLFATPVSTELSETLRDILAGLGTLEKLREILICWTWCFFFLFSFFQK